MKYKSGDQVWLKHTKTWATIIRLSADDMVIVRPFHDPDSIPVHINDIAKDSPKDLSSQSHGIETGIAAQGNFRFQDKGIWVAISIDPDHLEDRQYYVFLLQNRNNPIEYQGYIQPPYADKINFKGIILPGAWMLLTKNRLDQLNDHPDCHINLWEKLPNRQVALAPVHFRLKAKQILLSQKHHNGLSFNAALFPVAQKDHAEGSIPVITEKSTPAKQSVIASKISVTPHPTDFATFETIIDLHAEKLIKNQGKLTESEIFQIQVQRFDQYLAQAIRLGAERVFVIHGVGKGRLKDYIKETCDRNIHVIKAKNEFHPLFGFGATEIILLA